LTYFGAIVKLPVQDRFEAGSFRDRAALAVRQLFVPHLPANSRTSRP
jgi:hypothetical protein